MTAHGHAGHDASGILTSDAAGEDLDPARLATMIFAAWGSRHGRGELLPYAVLQARLLEALPRAPLAVQALIVPCDAGDGPEAGGLWLLVLEAERAGLVSREGFASPRLRVEHGAPACTGLLDGAARANPEACAWARGFVRSLDTVSMSPLRPRRKPV
jgi:hypothetical protein